MEAGRPAQIRSKILVQFTRLRTPIGLKLAEVTAGTHASISGYYYASISFPKHFDNRFVEAVAVLFAKLESAASVRDGGPELLGSVATIPQDLIERAWNAIASLTSCNDRRLRLMKDAFDQSCLLRSSDAVRNIAKAAQEYFLQSDTDITPSPYYSKYIELRLIDGYWVLAAMLNLLYETGKPEDVNSPALRKLFEASTLLTEESSRIRRNLDDEGCGYWSCLNRDEKEARKIGRHRACMLWRKYWDEYSENGGSFAALYLAKFEFRHDYTGLPGTAPWLAFQHFR